MEYLNKEDAFLPTETQCVHKQIAYGNITLYEVDKSKSLIRPGLSNFVPFKCFFFKCLSEFQASMLGN